MQTEKRKPAATATRTGSQSSAPDEDTARTAAKQEALRALRCARFCLLHCQYALDDAGTACPALDSVTEYISHLLSKWQGRAGEPEDEPDDEPAYIARVCEEYRQRRARSGGRWA